MDQKDIQIIKERYKARLREHGVGIKSLASGVPERRFLRFEVLREVGIKSGDKILDVGCGFADFYAHLEDRGVQVDYIGIDIVEELVEAGKQKYPQLELECRNIEINPFPKKSFDYVVCSQVFNLELGGEKNMATVKNILPLLYGIAKKGVAIDFITNYVDFKEKHLHYYSPENLFKYVKENITRSVTIRNDYPLFEFCLYLYPDFKGWSYDING
jgi:ubiquinone/menaquinone biosynthesis C-methylase UbiE